MIFLKISLFGIIALYHTTFTSFGMVAVVYMNMTLIVHTLFKQDLMVINGTFCMIKGYLEVFAHYL